MTQYWPYPTWVAHRGAGLAAPENTIAAFRHGYESGFRMFECDAKISADGVVYLLHDATLDRTTNGQGMAHGYIWDELSMLDAGSWHSEWFAGSSIATLEEVSRFCIERECFLNIEIKPSPGFDVVTGEQVAIQAKALWSHQKIQPLLTSFQPNSLRAALLKAPYIPRGLLVHDQSFEWRNMINELQCQAIAFHDPIIDLALINECQNIGLQSIAYTVNNAKRAQKLLSMGVNTIITDRMEFGHFALKSHPNDHINSGY